MFLSAKGFGCGWCFEVLFLFNKRIPPFFAVLGVGFRFKKAVSELKVVLFLFEVCCVLVLFGSTIRFINSQDIGYGGGGNACRCRNSPRVP
jgi:hypothetical protein